MEGDDDEWKDRYVRGDVVRGDVVRRKKKGRNRSISRVRVDVGRCFWGFQGYIE